MGMYSETVQYVQCVTVYSVTVYSVTVYSVTVYSVTVYSVTVYSTYCAVTSSTLRFVPLPRKWTRLR